MLTTRKINLAISITCTVLRYFFILYTAVILAKSIWWILSPSRSDIYVEWNDPDRADKSAGYVINRYPFGVVIIPKAVEAPKPRIVDKLKLTGVYLNTPKDSIAFVEYESKPLIVKQGQIIGDSDAILKSINDDSIVVTENGADATIKITYISQPANIGQSPSRASPFSANIPSGAANVPLPGGGAPTSDLRERRRKLMDDFNRERDQANQGGGVLQQGGSFGGGENGDVNSGGSAIGNQNANNSPVGTENNNAVNPQ